MKSSTATPQASYYEHSHSDYGASEASTLERATELPTGKRLSWMQRRVHGAIVFYQRAREGRPSPCRFFPTCSSYALEAFDTHGTWRGGWLTLRRLTRCRPLGPSGFDPVPPPSSTDQSSTDQKGR